MRRHLILPVPNGISDQTETIQRALDGGNAEIEIPPGFYPVSQTLRIYSNTTVRAAPHTVIRRTSGTALTVKDCLIRNADYAGDGNENIEICGGVWDMNNAGNPRGTERDVSYWGLSFCFDRVRGLTLRELTAANPDTYFIRLCRVCDFRVLDVKLYNSFPKINQDGVHINGFCHHGLIRGLHAISPLTPGDDMIALNAYDGLGHQNHGIELGPIEDISIEDVYAESAYGFFRFLTKDDASVRRIRIKKCRGGVSCLFLNANGFSEAKPGSGLIQDVEISDVKVFKVPGQTNSPEINRWPIFGLQLHMDNVVIRDVERIPLDFNCGVPTFQLLPEAGKILEFEPDPQNPCSPETLENGVISLRDGGFRLLRLGQDKA